MPDLNTLLTTAQAATILGRDPSTIRRNARRSGIGQHVGSQWLFTAADLERLPVRGEGRPPGAGNITERADEL